MITFDPYKQKNMTFKIEVQGISLDLLECRLRLSDNTIDYGFKGEIEEDKITFSIPPLKSIINEENLNSIKNIKLEVNDKNGKYYLKPFEDTVEIKLSSPKIAATVFEEKDESTKQDFVIKTSLLQETNKKENKPQKKADTKFKSFLKG